ncbi:acyl transferase/acyl hydrolase/lysophospholipase [Globomyces pollinis-pini]|nr:acyl transferase/acyl hydrolase/lysophospholipase [Globomyces pollinis-pini]
MAINLTLYTCGRIYVAIQEYLFQFYSPQRRMRQELKNSSNYEEWIETAKKIDKSLGLDQWKSKPTDEAGFDEHLLIKITNRLKRDRNPDMMHKLMATLQNSACKNDLAGVENERLYSHLHYGTKNTVEQYLNEVTKSLNAVAKSKEITVKEKIAFFKQASVTYGRTALCLSGGAYLAYFHLGVLKALFENGVLPKIMTGTSAGALMAATICTRTDDEIRNEIFVPTLIDTVVCCNDDIWTRIDNIWNNGAMFTSERFRSSADWFTKGDMTFLEAYEKTGRILNITAVSMESHSQLKVLNYINTPHVTVKSAVVASSSIPGVLPASELFMKDASGKIVPYYDAGRLWRGNLVHFLFKIDGSLLSDIPERELHQLFRVKHTVVSQVNPHISLFFYSPKGSAGTPGIYRSGKGWRGGFLAAAFVRYFLLDLNKWLTFIRDMDLLPRIMGANMSNLWLQRFEGNLTILPPLPTVMDLVRIASDPSKERLDQFIRDGELKTFPTIHMINNRLRIEKCIDELYKTICQNEGISHPDILEH